MPQADQRHLLTGPVERDETEVGGKPRPGPQSTAPDDKPTPGRGTKKTPGVGAVDRDGEVRAKGARKDQLKGQDLRACVRTRVTAAPARLMTDADTGSSGLERLVPHPVIKHADEYVKGEIHPTTLEGLWALLNRGLVGQFHSVSRRHLQKDVDEFCSRYTLRKGESEEAFGWTLLRGWGV